MAIVVELNAACEQVPPGKVVELLKKHGTIVTIEEAPVSSWIFLKALPISQWRKLYVDALLMQ